ncbi:hypothetical protein P3W53_28530 [Pseudomonas denitrificans (nom. rej.)]|nr:hypothetical protein [Pseudomonas denitrificans (nom. rej.)]
MTEFIVISVKHTKRRHKAITLWRPADRGYCWTLERAGRYEEAHVLHSLGYYNSGCTNIAVPLELAEQLAANVEYDTKEFGICLPNDAATWQQLLAQVIRPPRYPAEPEYHGAPRRKAEA